eukprot:scaffold1739_cov109-Cylindrotheca_fusiformis.AAC.3
MNDVKDSSADDDDDESNSAPEGSVLFLLWMKLHNFEAEQYRNVDFLRCLPPYGMLATTKCQGVLLILVPLRRWDKKDAEGESREAMQPRLFHHGIGLRNNSVDILGLSVEKCHEPKRLFAMGRLLWHAYLNASTKMKPWALTGSFLSGLARTSSRAWLGWTGQDKNRLGQMLERLSDSSNVTTNHK